MSLLARLSTLLFLGILVAPVWGQQLKTIDHIYDPKVETVLLFPQVSTNQLDPSLTLNPPVISLDEQVALQLEFDDLTATYRSFRARIVHCNADWQRSILNDIEFTYEYNDNPITEYQNSINTKIPYYHYRFTLPKLKLPGNYLLVVYDERNRNNIIFTRRFCTYQNRVQITAEARFSTDPARQFSDQQIDLSINYKGYQVISPQDDFKVVIRQNYRDDREIRGLRPTNVQSFDQTLEYKLIDLSNTMLGGNEYRFFDTRTVLSRANYIDRIDRLADRNVVYVQTDKSRNQGPYIQSDDFNGQFVIDQRETSNGATNADYIETVFTLKIPEVQNWDIYVNGAFNFWQLNDRNRMSFDALLGAYRATILLKQGVYNYDYVGQTTTTPPKTDEHFIEGSYSGTENDYEIFVYHRPPASRADQLIAYQKIGVNKRK
ncbi:type IX secretion system plug protein [Spirosoma litoris]